MHLVAAWRASYRASQGRRQCCTWQQACVMAARWPSSYEIAALVLLIYGILRAMRLAGLLRMWLTCEAPIPVASHRMSFELCVQNLDAPKVDNCLDPVTTDHVRQACWPC